MGLTKTDLTAIRAIVHEVVHNAIDASEKRTNKKFELLTLQIGQGFNEVSKRFEKSTIH